MQKHIKSQVNENVDWTLGAKDISIIIYTIIFQIFRTYSIESYVFDELEE